MLIGLDGVTAGLVGVVSLMVGRVVGVRWVVTPDIVIVPCVLFILY